jgi:hypothetical protein
MAVFNLTSADNGRVLASTAGTITAIEVPSAGGTSGWFSLTDAALNDQRGFWQPLIAIDLDYPALVAIANKNPSGTLQPQLNLLGAAVFSEVPAAGYAARRPMVNDPTPAERSSRLDRGASRSSSENAPLSGEGVRPLEEKLIVVERVGRVGDITLN